MLKERKIWLGLAVCILPFLLYINTLNHDYVLDDFSVIKENFVVKKGLDGIPEIFETHYRYGYGYNQANLYRPLTLSFFALQWEIAPDNPSLGHFINIFIYSLCCVLLFVFLVHLLGKSQTIFAFVCSIIFAAHPIHTEVVANIKSLDEILALSFCLLAAIFYFRFLDQKKAIHLIIANLIFFLALLSKESSVVFMGIIPLALGMKRELKLKEIFSSSLWMLIPTFIFLFMRISVLGSLSGDKSIAMIDNLLLAAPNKTVEIATAIKILGLYLWKLCVPYPLMNDYSFNQITLSNFQDWSVWLAFLIYATMILFYFKYRLSKPVLAFGFAFYLISISLYSNLFLTIGTSFGERLMFMPSIGFSIMVAFLFFKITKTDIASRNTNGLLLSLVILLVGLYSIKTVNRNGEWKDNFTLYSTDVKNCDRSARCHYYHGLGLMKDRAMQMKNEAQKTAYLNLASQAFTKALEILPSYSEAFGQRGLVYYRLKNYQAALSDYNSAVELNPQNATAYSNRGTLLFELGDYQNAKSSFEQALKFKPNFVDALANYASTLGTLGDFQGSIRYFLRAIDLRPNEPSYYQMIGMSYQNLGKNQEANIYFNKAKQINLQKQ